jgi:hypothetical protein
MNTLIKGISNWVIVFAVAAAFLYLGMTIQKRNSPEMTVEEATHWLVEYCTIEYNQSQETLYIIVNETPDLGFYKRVGVLEEHYVNIVLLHVSEINKGY